MTKIQVANLLISDVSQKEFLSKILELHQKSAHAYVVTPYSEFFLNAQKDSEFLEVLNQADISTADGFGVFLAKYYLSQKGVYGAMLKTLFKAFFQRKVITQEFKAKLSGSRFIYEVAELAAKNNLKIFFLGGFDLGNGNTGELTAKKLKQLYPELQVAGVYSGSAKVQEEEEIINRINASDADLLFIAYGPIAQEKWAARNRNKLKPLVSFCLGGTFDYVSGEKKQVPKYISKIGLEWLFRPFISERGNPKMMWKRLNRAWGGTLKLIFFLIKFKKQNSDGK